MLNASAQCSPGFLVRWYEKWDPTRFIVPVQNPEPEFKSPESRKHARLALLCTYVLYAGLSTGYPLPKYPSGYGYENSYPYPIGYVWVWVWVWVWVTVHSLPNKSERLHSRDAAATHKCCAYVYHVKSWSNCIKMNFILVFVS